MIKIYSTPVCPECMKLKNFLRDKGVVFQEINVLEDKEAANFVVSTTGMRRVPVFQAVEDGGLIVGFNKEEIEKALDSLGLPKIKT